jgi:dTDP-glucose pyrophosphorylase
MSKPYVRYEPFLLTAGDTLILSKNKPEFLIRMFDAFKNSNAAVILLLQEVSDPRAYGVASYFGKRRDLLRLSEVIEKPEKPKTNLAIMPFYVLTPAIFDAIEKIRPGRGGEIQLTDAIQFLIADGYEVLGVKLRDDELRLDIGTPETYWEAQAASYQHFASDRAT